MSRIVSYVLTGRSRKLWDFSDYALLKEKLKSEINHPAWQAALSYKQSQISQETEEIHLHHSTTAFKSGFKPSIASFPHSLFLCESKGILFLSRKWQKYEANEFSLRRLFS